MGGLVTSESVATQLKYYISPFLAARYGHVTTVKWWLLGNVNFPKTWALGFAPVKSLPGIIQRLGVRVRLQLFYCCVPSLPPTTLVLLLLLLRVTPFQERLFLPSPW